MIRQRLATDFEVGRGRLAEGLRVGRDRKTIVPEDIEGLRKLPHHRSRNDEIEVSELELRARLKILVADIAPAGHRNGVVADEELVVHPVIEPAGLEQEFDAAQHAELLPRQVGIEDTNFDVGVRHERPDSGAAVDSQRVVEQQPDPHTAVRCGQQGAEQQLSGIVLLQQEILGIERLLGFRGDAHAHRKAAGAVHQKAEAGKSRVGPGARADPLAERRGFRPGEGGGFGLRSVEAGGHRRTARSQRRRCKGNRHQKAAPTGRRHLSLPSATQTA